MRLRATLGLLLAVVSSTQVSCTWSQRGATTGGWSQPGASTAPSPRGAPTRSEVIAALRGSGHDFSVGRLRDAEQELAQGHRAGFDSIRQGNFCGFRTVAADLDMACRYLEALGQAPAAAPQSRPGLRQPRMGQPRASQPRASQPQASQRGRGTTASISERLEEARCDGYGCFNVWVQMCQAERSRLLSDARSCNVFVCVRDMADAQRVEADCVSVPAMLRRLSDVRPPRELRGLARSVAALARQRIATEVGRADACIAAARAPVRCLIPNASQVPHDRYVGALRGAVQRPELSSGFPRLTASISAELRALERTERSEEARCADAIRQLSAPPDQFFEQLRCTPATLTDASWTRIHDGYVNQWDAAQERMEAARRQEAERRAAEERRLQAEAERQRQQEADAQERQRRAEQARFEAEQRASEERARRAQLERERLANCHSDCRRGCGGDSGCVSLCIAQSCR